MKPLHVGRYKATCKERNALAAAMNGHGLVFSEASCMVSEGQAVFDREGVQLWRCSAACAEVYFKLERIG